MGNLKTVGLDEIRTNNGFSGAITARAREDESTGEPFYEIVDGLHRYSACKDAGCANIGIDVVELDDDQVLVTQILANVHKIETKPADYARQLKRLMGRDQMLTESGLASKLGKSPQWIKSMLGLNKISNEKIKTLINSGKIPLMSAYALAKLPDEEQAAFVDRAMTLKPKEFVPLANERVKELKDAARKGTAANPATFEPRAFLRKLKEIQAGEVDGAFVSNIVNSNGVTDAAEAFVLALQWVQNVDPAGRQAQTEKHEVAKRKREAEKERRKAEREAAKVAAKAAKEDEAARAASEAHEVSVGR